MSNGADYLVITHDTFTDAVYPLCELRDSLGLSVKMAEVSLIYSTFPNGPRTDRIRAFMERVYGYWNPRPEFVLLVGDACKDTTLGDFVPAKRFPKFSYYYAGGLTEHGADCWYATLSGVDSTPDIIVGRLPVNRPAQAESVVAKILRYETGTDTGRWTSTVLSLASTDRQPDAVEMETTFFRPAGDSVYTVYESQGQSGFLRHKTLTGFNQGAVFVSQCTHGGLPPAWAGSRTLFSYLDVDSLTNLDGLPFVIGRG
ncbi:hypothetical protein FJY71_00610 [candidate division WOR-3 bacterium]|nr:hypothetical protein [candidate division WOR-3 bacterium]